MVATPFPLPPLGGPCRGFSGAGRPRCHSLRGSPGRPPMSGVALWWEAARPRTLPAALVPVVVGSAVAAEAGSFRPLPALLCALFALLVQVGTNYANDYYDAVQGADDEKRTGPRRAVASGEVAPAVMRRAAYGVLAVAFLLGLSLLLWGGWWLLGVGVASVVAAVAYTAQPLALGYRGLGDVFVVLFFGVVAVGVTAYVQVGGFPPGVWGTGVVIGLLVNNLLVINNDRDLPNDRRTGKRTLAVRLGRWVSFALLGASLVGAVLLVGGWASLGDRPWTLLSLAGLVPLVRLLRALPGEHDRVAYGRFLAAAARALLAFGLLLAVGLVLGG